MAKDEEDENDDLNYSDPNDDCTEVENFQAYDIRVHRKKPFFNLKNF
jgi:hypothetical protein